MQVVLGWSLSRNLGQVEYYAHIQVCAIIEICIDLKTISRGW